MSEQEQNDAANEEHAESQDVESTSEPRELTAEDEAKLAELSEALEKYESQKRWSDVIRTIRAQADIHVDPHERAALLRRAGEMYVTKSSNQAEAIKCYEGVLELLPSDEEALQKLREMYEKRRDWEKLILTMRRQTELMPVEERAASYEEMAQLASKRLRKPEACIELWQLVLENDSSHAEALDSLVKLYERAKEWAPLADVLDRLVENTSDDATLKQYLQKLGTIRAEKLGDDEAAVTAFQRLLDIDPNDRRAQEQLKRRFISLRDWDRLEDFYGASGKWDELIRVLEREADSADRPDEDKVTLLFKAATLWADQKERTDRSARALEKVLSIQGDSLEAARRLTAIYEEANDAKKLVTVYEVQYRHEEDAETRLEFLRKAAELYEERLRNVNAAFELFRDAFSQQPMNEEIRGELDRLAEATGEWVSVNEAYEGVIGDAGEGEDSLALRVLYGKTLVKVDRDEDAIRQFEMVRAIQDDHPAAIAALGELYRSTGRHEELLAVYDQRLESEVDGEKRREVGYARASLIKNHMGDDDGAIAAFEDVLNEHGMLTAEAFRDLSALYATKSRWDDQIALIERRIDGGPDSTEELVALKFALAKATSDHRDDHGSALELYREVLILEDEHEGTRERLESLLAEESVAATAASLLEPLYEVQGKAAEQIKVLAVMREAENDAAEKLSLATKAAEICRTELNDLEGCFACLAEGLRAVADDAGTLVRLEELAEAQSWFPRLIGLLREVASGSDDPSQARKLYIHAAGLADDQLQDLAGATECFESVLEQDDADVEVLVALESLHRRGEKWSKVVQVLRKRADVESDAEQRESLLTQAATILEELLEDREAAIALHREILEINPGSISTLNALNSLLEGLERWSDLADNLERQLEVSGDPSDQAAVLLRIAELRRNKLGSVEAAIETYREVLERDRGNEAAIAALEALLADENHQLTAAEILEPIYNELGDASALIPVHEVQVLHAEAAERRVELLHRIAELHEDGLDDADKAYECYSRALAEDPGDARTQEHLERISAAQGAWERLATTYEGAVAEMEDADLFVSLLTRAAQIREDQLSDSEAAVAHYRSVLERDPENLDTTAALERLYQALEKYQDLAAICVRRAELLMDAEQQKEYLFRAGAIHEELLESPQDALGVYLKVLEVDDEDLVAIDKLIEIYLQSGNWSELLGVYQRKADIVVDPEEKKRIYVEAGAVYERELKDVPKAVDTYNRMLEIDPDDQVALERLDYLHAQSESWEDLLGILERRAELSAEPMERLSLRHRIGAVWQTNLGDATRAIDVFRDVLESSPDHEPTLNALEAMISAGAEVQAAATALEPIYEESGEWAKLCRVLDVLVEHVDDPLGKVEYLHKMAQIQEIRLEDTSAAFSAYARALPCDNLNDTTCGSLERLAEELGRWEELSRVYDTELEKLAESDSSDVVDFGLRLGTIFEVQLEDAAGAIARYATVRRFDDRNVQALESLDRLYEATEQWELLASVLSDESGVANTPDEILGLQYRLGRVYQGRLGRTSEAIQCYREILGAAPEHEGALGALETLFEAGESQVEIGEILESIYRMREAWPSLMGVLSVQAAAHPDQDEKLAIMHRIAEIAESRAFDADTAFAWMQRALLSHAGDEHAMQEAERLADALDGWSLLANTYADVISGDGEAQARLEIGRRLANMYEQQLEDVDKAEATYRFLLSIDANDEASLAQLDRIYCAAHAYQALADVLGRRAKVASHPDDEVDHRYRLGMTQYRDLGLPDAALETFGYVLAELDPSHLDSIHAVQSIYTGRGDWQNLFIACDQELDAVMGDQPRSEVLSRMARLASGALSDPTRAVSLWGRVLDLRGEDLEALNALGDIHCQTANWRDLVDVLEREVNVVDDDTVRMKIFGDLATVWGNQLERPRNAIDYWERVLDVDPHNVGALFKIAEIHRGQEQWTDLIDIMRRVSDVGAASLDDDSLEAVHLEIGTTFEERLGQPLDAVDDYNTVLDTNPNNYAAMDALERIHRSESNWEDVCGVLEQRYRAVEDPAGKVKILLEIADTWSERAEMPDRGSSALSRVIEIEPLHDDAFQRLDVLHRESARWEELVDLYITRAESIEDDAERVRLLREVSRIYEEDLQNLDNAFDALTFAWSQDFADMDTARALERVAGLTNQWSELLTVANEALKEAQEEGDEPRQIAICLNAARWYGQELGHAEYAGPYYDQILSLDPGNVAALLQRADLYRDTQQWEQMASSLNQLLGVTQDPSVLANANVQLGELAERHLGEPERAIQYYERAFELDLSNVEALQALERRYEQDGNWNRLVEVLSRKVRELEGLEGEIPARLQLARALEVHAQNPQGAIEQLEQVLVLDERHEQAVGLLDPLYLAVGNWAALKSNLELQLEFAGTERAMVELHSRISGLLEQQFLKPEEAAEHLERALEIDARNTEALTGLVRLYRSMQRWDDLVQALERSIAATPEREPRMAAYKALADVYFVELGQLEMAADAYHNVLAMDEQDHEALSGLARLYSKQGDHTRAVEMMEQLAERAPTQEQKIDLLYRAGQLLDKELGDRYMAQERYQSALDVDGNHLPSMQALRAIYEDSGDWVAAARLLETESTVQTNVRLAARACVELGRVYGERLDDPSQALQAFEKANQLDPDNLEAMLPIAEEYVRQGRHEEAIPYLESVTQRGGAKEPAEQIRLNVTLGRSAAELGKYSDAVRAFARAHSMDPANVPALLGLASAHFASEDWAQAFKYYQMLLVHHRETLVRDEITDVFYRLGVVKRHQSDLRKAINFFDKALEEDPIHRPSLEELVSIYTDQRNWEQVIHFKRQLIDLAETNEERVQMLEEIGDLWGGQARNHEKAIEAYLDGSSIDPTNHKLLHKLLEAYQSTRKWDRAIDIIEQVSDLDGRPEAQARYIYTIGVILRDELKDPDAAVAKFEQALDLDSSRLKAFEAINKLLTQTKDWKRLERSFRKMIHRVVGQGNADLEFNLWHNLGVIYRDRQKNYEAAAEAFKMAADCKPDNAAERIILSELYGRLPERVNEAIEAHQWLLRDNPNRKESYQALYRLYFDAHAHDKAWCVAATLTHLGAADEEHKGFYEQYNRSGVIRPSTRLGNEQWVKLVHHPDQSAYVSKIMEILARAIHQLKSSSDKALGLQRKYQQDLQTAEATFPKTYGFVTQVMNLSIQPRLFVQQDQAGGLMHVPGSNPPAVAAGNSLLSGYQPQDLAFVLGRYLSYYRPEHFLRTLESSHNALKVYLLSGLHLGGVESTEPAVLQTVQTLSTALQPAEIEALRQTVSKFAASGGTADIKQWMQAVELTALRAGFLMCGDLDAAKRSLQVLPAEMTHDLKPDEKFRELVLFSVSPRYFELREALGITIQV